MTIKDLSDALAIFMPYYDDASSEFTYAEHDEFYLPATDKPMSEEDVKKVKGLGWFQPEASEDEECDSTEAEYNPEYDWQHFT